MAAALPCTTARFTLCRSQQVSRLCCDPSSQPLQDLVKRWIQHSRRLDRQGLKAVACCECCVAEPFALFGWLGGGSGFYGAVRDVRGAEGVGARHVGLH